MVGCALFIRSYWKDLQWLALCLASIERHCLGFEDVIVVVPRKSEPWLRRANVPRSSARVELCDDYADDYLGQQVTKLGADRFTQAEFICHVDADCIFTRSTCPDDLVIDGRPRISMRRVERLGRERPWQASTERFLGWPVRYDFMYHPPFTYPRWLYGRVREHAVATHGVSLEEYVTAQPPRGFSEFNVLGAFAWARYHDSFEWIERTRDRPADPRCRWYWSWGGLDDQTRREIGALIGGEAGDS